MSYGGDDGVYMITRVSLKGGEKLRFRPEGADKHMQGTFVGFTTAGSLLVAVGETHYTVSPITTYLDERS